MSDQPANYIAAALSSVGITCQTLVISDYAPETFGNLVAKAETNVGVIDIVYDRGFFLEADDIDDPEIAQIVEALERYKRSSTS